MGTSNDEILKARREVARIRKELALPEGTVVFSPGGTAGVIGADGKVIPHSVQPIEKALAGLNPSEREALGPLASAIAASNARPRAVRKDGSRWVDVSAEAGYSQPAPGQERGATRKSAGSLGEAFRRLANGETIELTG